MSKVNDMLFGISNPHNIFIRVDLPEPLEPLIPIKSPFFSRDIPIFEGVAKIKTFLSGENEERQIFVIPDNAIDTATANVLVYDTGSNQFLFKPAGELNPASHSLVDENGDILAISESHVAIIDEPSSHSLYRVDVEDTDTYFVSASTPSSPSAPGLIEAIVTVSLATSPPLLPS